MDIIILITLMASIIYLTYVQNHQKNKTLYIIIIFLLFLCVLYLCGNIYENYKEFITYGIIFLVLMFCVIYVYSPKVEGMTSEEALKNVASIYNSDNMVVKNLKVTGNLDVAGNANISGTSQIPNINGNTKISGNLNVNGTSQIPNINGNTIISGNLAIGGSALIPRIEGNISIPNINGNVQVNGDLNVSNDLRCNRLYASKHIYGSTIAGCLRHFDQQGGSRNCNLVYTLAASNTGDKMRWYLYDGGPYGESIGGIWG